MAEFNSQDQARIVRGVKLAEKLARAPRNRKKDYTAAGGGGAAILAVVTECAYDEVTHSLTVTCSRLLATDYDYEPEPEEGDTFTAWAGIDPLVVVDSIVLLHRIVPMPDERDIVYFAQPVLSVERTTLDMPDMVCLTAYTEPCGPQQVTEVCLPE